MMTKNYDAAKLVLGFTEFTAWMSIAGGFILAAAGAEAGRKSFDGGGLMAAAGLAISVVGFLSAAFVQGSKAAIDIAEMTREMLEIAREQRSGVRKDLRASPTDPAHRKMMGAAATSNPVKSAPSESTDLGEFDPIHLAEAREAEKRAARLAAISRAYFSSNPSMARLASARKDQPAVEDQRAGQVVVNTLADAPPAPEAVINSSDDRAAVAESADVQPDAKLVDQTQPSAASTPDPAVETAPSASLGSSTVTDAAEPPKAVTTPAAKPVVATDTTPSPREQRRSAYVARSPRGLPPEHVKHKGRIIQVNRF